MKRCRFLFMLLMIAVACAAITTASAEASDPLQAALLQSRWNAYTLVTEAHDDTLYAGVAANGAGQTVFIIAQPKSGAISIAIAYEKLIPSGMDLSTLQIFVDGTKQSYTVPYVSLTLSAPDDAYTSFVSFLQDGDGQWRFDRLAGPAGGNDYWVDYKSDKNMFYFSCTGSNFGATDRLDALDISPENLSYTDVLQTAVTEISDAEARGNAELIDRLRVNFPADSWANAEVVEFSREHNEDHAVYLVIIDRPDTRTVYLIDQQGSKLLTFETNHLVPLTADLASLHTYIPCEYLYGSLSYVELDFTVGEARHIVTVSRSPLDEFSVSALEIYQDESGWTVDFLDDTLRFYPDTYRLDYIYRPLDSSQQTIQTYDSVKIDEVLQQAYADFIAGNAPYIPAFEDEYTLPQPCGAKLFPGVYEVYSGPGKQYYREADGKACVSTNDWIQVFGRDGNWALVQYRVKGSLLRFGYIEKEAFRDFEKVPKLRFDSSMLWQDNQFVTSNPLSIGGDIFLTGGNVSLKRLATLDACWVYVELTLPDGSPARMFAETTPSHG
ncbi:MAG: hypothetical protein PHY64_06240 [Eubacteriales bacterium]|nr:hypothetical protein [Eubacteriales bacterium]